MADHRECGNITHFLQNSWGNSLFLSAIGAAQSPHHFMNTINKEPITYQGFDHGAGGLVTCCTENVNFVNALVRTITYSAIGRSLKLSKIHS